MNALLNKTLNAILDTILNTKIIEIGQYSIQ